MLNSRFNIMIMIVVVVVVGLLVPTPRRRWLAVPLCEEAAVAVALATEPYRRNGNNNYSHYSDNHYTAHFTIHFHGSRLNWTKIIKPGLHTLN